MKIALDVMGFEGNINQAIKAARLFCKKNKGNKIILVGNKNLIETCLKQEDKFQIVDTQEFIKMDDTPIAALRKQKSSMKMALELVKAKKAHAAVSAGNTSCFVPLVQTVLGTVETCPKFGFMPFIPTVNGKGFNMIDVGANINVTGDDLYHYALMANEYARIVRKIPQPKIGLLNIGTEQHKGFEYHQKANQLLKSSPHLNYVGFVEPKELLNGVCDVVVCDGFSGNIALKAMEGALRSVSIILKKGYKMPWNWLGAAFSGPIIYKLTHTFDYRNNAGAIVLGADGIAVKTHGSADSKQFYAALKVAHECVENDLLHNIKRIKYE